MIAIILAGIARVCVGMGLAGRWYVYPPVALFVAYSAFGPSIWTPIFAAVAALNVGLGWTKWDDRIHQAVRYSIMPAIIAVAFMLFGGNASILLWPLFCAVIGATEIDIRRGLESHGFTLFGRSVSSAQYAEFFIGAFCIGGMMAVRIGIA